jgi:NhaP-type Na+/H+ or K+/H+ antiporter
MGLEHPLVGIEWIVTFIIMIIVIILRNHGYAPASLYGLLIGGIVSYCIKNLSTTPLNYNVDSFMYMLLPPIVLQSGLEFKWTRVKYCWGTALTMAWLGTIVTSFWVGYAVYIFHDVEYIIIALWIGGILGPTDAVSTRESVKDLRKNAKMVLEYESILNDAVSIMIVHICQRLWFNTIQINSKDIIEIIVFNMFLLVISVIIGVCCAYVAKVFVKTPTIVFLLALIGYAFCECIQSSGIISIFSFGITFQFNCPENYLKDINIISKALSEFAEIYIYVSIGVIVILTEFKYINIGGTVILACFTSRIICVFFVTWIASYFGPAYTLIEKISMSMCGVRGALSLTLALSAPDNMKEIFITVTTVELLFSMVCTILWMNVSTKFYEQTNSD